MSGNRRWASRGIPAEPLICDFEPCSLNRFAFGREPAPFRPLLQYVPHQVVGVIIARPEIGKLVKIADRRDPLLPD